MVAAIVAPIGVTVVAIGIAIVLIVLFVVIKQMRNKGELTWH